MDTEPHSLIDRAIARLAMPRVRGGGAPRIDWRLACALAGVIMLGPLLTIVGAALLAEAARGEAARLHARNAPRMSIAKRDDAARAMLRGSVRDAPVAVWLDRVAAALPAEARVSRMARTADGAMMLEVTAPDPDALRVAIRRDPALTGFREAGQRRAGAMVLITWRRDA